MPAASWAALWAASADGRMVDRSSPYHRLAPWKRVSHHERRADPVGSSLHLAQAQFGGRMSRTQRCGPSGVAGVPPRGRGPLWLAACVVVAGAALLAGPPRAGAAVIAPVVTGRGDTWDPSATVDATTSVPVFAWTLYRRGVPRALLRVGAQKRLKMNRRGIGWAWSVDSSSSTAAYQQDRGGNSDVKFYDWQTQAWAKPGPSVDTDRWEYEPALSGHWLVFGRLNRRATPD